MSDYLFPREKMSFDEVFPELEDVNINVKYLRGGGREESSASFTKDNFPGNGLNCNNPVCKNGGLSPSIIRGLIKKMISEKKTEIKDHEFCNGGSYRGHTRDNDCGWGFNIEIAAKYKEET